MKEYIIGPNEAGQRLDKYLKKLLALAPDSFLYKMLRKKNITRNKKAAAGSEKLAEGDCITLFLSDETIEKFRQKRTDRPAGAGKVSGLPVEILYEDQHVLLLNKPAGVLSQPDASHQVSMVEWVTSYLLEKGVLTAQDLATFRPAVCNRLDRNTSGILAAGKSLPGSQGLSELFRERKVKKYYFCLVHGQIREPMDLRGYLCKNRKSNRVFMEDSPSENSVFIHTRYRPVEVSEAYTLLEAELITGKTHQIRAQLLAHGYPIAGDPKYGNPVLDRPLKKRFGSFAQLLHARRLVFDGLDGALSGLSHREITAPLPEQFDKIKKEIMYHEH